MNYLKYKKEYPLTLSYYFKWTVEESDSSKTFDSFLENFFKAGIESGSDGGEYYYSQLHIDQEKYVEILQVKFPELYDEYEEEIIIDLVEEIENAYKCVEYILANNFKG